MGISQIGANTKSSSHSVQIEGSSELLTLASALATREKPTETLNYFETPDAYLYHHFKRQAWINTCPLTETSLTERELAKLRGTNERISMDEVREIYLPLSKLLILHVNALRKLHEKVNQIFPKPVVKVPYIIGIAGSVAVGKSTTARILQALLSRRPNHLKVDLVPTDGFLFPNRTLQERGLMSRKGFPESYDIRKLITFVSDIKSGRSDIEAPVYSHLRYDIVENERLTIRHPDVVILEGLNVLQTHFGCRQSFSQVSISDFFDFSIYVDAQEKDIENWYLERFAFLRRTALHNPNSYFHRYTNLSETEALKYARDIWHQINAVNLQKNIAPTKARAQLILEKGRNHQVESVYVRNL